MKKVTCTNGHFFDADRFDSCPICGQGYSESKPEALGGSALESEETVPLPQSCAIDELAVTTWVSPNEMRKLWGDILPAEEEPASEQKLTEEPEETVPPSQPVDELAPTMWTVPDLDASSESEEGGGQAPEGVDAPETDELDSCPKETPEPDASQGTEEACAETLAEADKPDMAAQPQMTLAQAVAASDAVGISPVLQPVQQKAADPAANPAGLPVGWLVGLSGSIRGKVFPCKSGRNRIGRERQMDISLPEDLSVDPVNHAQIIYEPKKRQFFIQAGNGDGLSYLNSELVFTHEELHAYDRISLGETAFVFLPLCGECFDWDTNTCGE